MKEKKKNIKVVNLICDFFTDVITNGKPAQETKEFYLKSNSKLTQEDLKDLEEGINNVIFCVKTMDPKNFKP